MQWKPNVTVAAVVHRDGRFLIVEESVAGAAVFNQPAGHLERDETLLEAVRREVKEETGWAYEPEALIGVYLFPDSDAGVTYLRFCFSGSCDAHDPEQQLDAGIVRAVWLTRAELDAEAERLRSPLVLRCIDDYLAGRRYPLELLDVVHRQADI
jgi:phosphatase NudJ